jgi:hypothetical protein
MRTYVRACGVNRRAWVCACGLSSCTLEARLTSVKFIFLIDFFDCQGG